MKFNHPSSHKETEDDYFSGSEAIESEAEEDNAQDENKEDEDKKKPVKIRVVVRKPQPKLDPTRLCGVRGLKCLLEIFDKFKTKGDGHEFRELDTILSKYEYWAHRLFPRMKFEDVIERLEKLGEKREVKSMLYNIRLGDDNKDTIESNLDYDPALDDERVTEKVMNMMKNINNSDSELDDDVENFLSTFDNRNATISSSSKSNNRNKIDDEDDDNSGDNIDRIISSRVAQNDNNDDGADENEIFNRLLSAQNA